MRDGCNESISLFYSDFIHTMSSDDIPDILNIPDIPEMLDIVVIL